MTRRRAVLIAQAKRLTIVPTDLLYVSPTGSGVAFTDAAPCSLAFALSGGGGVVTAGKTVRLKPGTYTGNFTSSLVGVRVEATPYQRCHIVASDPTLSTLTINGSDSTYVGLEVSLYNSSNHANRQVKLNGVCVNMYGPRTKVQNCLLHDGENCFGMWSQADNSELYGNIMIHAGYYIAASSTEGRGYGLYIQSDSTALVENNHFLMGFSYGVHAYTEQGVLNSIYCIDNTVAQSGVTNYANTFMAPGFMIGGGNTPAIDFRAIGNVTFQKPWDANRTAGGGNNLDYGSGIINGTVTGNYFSGTADLACSLGGPTSLLGDGTVVSRNCTVTGNDFIGAMATQDSSLYPSNNYISWRPSTGTKIKLLANRYQSDRYELSIVNWAETSTVSVPIAAGTYEVHTAFDYWGATQTIVSNGTLVMPMTGWSVQAPMGCPTPPYPGAIFGDFVLLKTA